jgi:hypothetical protein
MSALMLVATRGVEILALAILALAIWHNKRVSAEAVEAVDDRLDRSLAQSREALASYKLEVAKSYATVGLIKDVERRLTEHLIRIEAKLSQQAPQ